jgi:indole-3-glycerol phosphate synthase
MNTKSSKPKLYGADLILLIAAVLIKSLSQFAKSLGGSTIKVHNKELEKRLCQLDMIG